MRVAVVGASGQIGSHTVVALERAGHEVVRVGRATGADVCTGAGLAEALAGIDSVLDVTNNRSQDEAEIVEFFRTGSQHLLAAGRQAGVRHHVVLSVVGIDNGQRVPHYAGKRAQERLVAAGPVPWTIVRSTQFHELAARAATMAERDGVATIAPLLVQPIAPADVGRILAEVATGEPHDAVLEIAGPRTEDFVDMARRTLAARGQQIDLVPTWRGIFDTSMSGEVLLPGPEARIAPTTFESWLTAGGQ